MSLYHEERLMQWYLYQARWHYEQYQKWYSHASMYRQWIDSLVAAGSYGQGYEVGCDSYDVHGDEHYSSKESFLVDNEVKDCRRDSHDSQVTLIEDMLSIPSSCRGKQRKERRRRRRVKNVDHEQDAFSEDLEVDPAFRDFLLKSAQFRRDRDKKKESSGMKGSGEDSVTCEDVEYVDITRKGPEGTIHPPVALNRKELYTEKYGDGGAVVLSLETALQWKFNKFCDSNAPKPWPSIPLRF